MFIYIVKCSDGSLYTGITHNLSKRIEKHNSGSGSIFVKSRRPVSLVYWEEVNDKFQAARREREIKGWKKSKKENLVKLKSLH